MTETTNRPPSGTGPTPPRWGAVYALTLCVSTLVASEFMPVSLLTPIATGLHLTEGQAGQAISTSGLFAVVTSLFISAAAPRLDRRALLLGLTALVIASGLVVAFAPDFAVLIVGRALVGMVIGGFWSMSVATVMRLVPAPHVPRGLAILNGGNALATTVAAPLGSFLGQFVGWRGAFFAVVPLAVATFVWLSRTLPSMPSAARPDPLAAFRVLRRPQVPLGMAATALFFMGQFALFTYLRPFLETVTGVDVTVLSLLLLALGAAGLVGTFLVGPALKVGLHKVLVAMPLAMGVLALCLVQYGSSLAITTALLALWGLIGTAAPVGWWTWLSQALPDEAEAGGGLMVAVVQLAITVGAVAGGILLDRSGYDMTFSFSAALFCGSAVLAFLAARDKAASPANRCRQQVPSQPM